MFVSVPLGSIGRMGVSKAAGCALSIYIDDMTLSGVRVTQKLIWAVKQCIHGAGLRYHEEKRAVDRACEVTGAIITNGELRVPNRQHKKLREAKKAKDRQRSSKDSAKIVGALAGLKGQFDQITNANAKRTAGVG